MRLCLIVAQEEKIMTGTFVWQTLNNVNLHNQIAI